MQIPATFQPLNLSRDREWATFPLSARTFIWEQHRELQLHDRSVWASRYRNDESRLATLKEAHQRVLKDLRKQWDDGAFEGVVSWLLENPDDQGPVRC